MIPKQKKGQLYVVSGASGTGKTTLCRFLEKEMELFFSVSATTRERRAGEVEGKDYFFLTPQEFKKKIQNGDFLEWAEVHGHRYGTLRAPIEERIDRGESVLLDLDTQGALNFKKEKKEAVLIFIKPPTLEELQKRLEARGTDSNEVVSKRIHKAEEEIAQSDRYDYVVINEDLTKAEKELVEIIKVKEAQKNISI